VGASTANVVLCAGGGGGGGAANKGPGYGGGNGGSATSSLGNASNGAGDTGSSNPDNSFSANPSGGAGGSNGAGGAGGAANDTKYNVAGKADGDGIGGMGGPVHLGDGPSSPTLWTNLLVATDSISPNSCIPVGLLGGDGECREEGDIEGQPDGNMIAEGGGGGVDTAAVSTKTPTPAQTPPVRAVAAEEPTPPHRPSRGSRLHTQSPLTTPATGTSW
jgi:hypothetical protein